MVELNSSQANKILRQTMGSPAVWKRISLPGPADSVGRHLCRRNWIRLGGLCVCCDAHVLEGFT